MSDIRAPRIQTTEQPPASRSIVGMSTSTYALVGLFAKGPIGVPTCVTGLAEAHRLFGRPTHNTNGMRVLQLYFAQGGQRAYVTRTVHYGDVAKPHTLTAKVARVSIPDNNPHAGKAASGTVTLKAMPKEGDSVTIHNVAFTYGDTWPVAEPQLPTATQQQSDKQPSQQPQQAAATLAQAINSCTNDKIRTVVTAHIDKEAPQQLQLSCSQTGKAGNSIALAASNTKACTLSAKTLTDGQDSQAQPCLQLQAADGAGAHANGRTIHIEADTQPGHFRLSVLQEQQLIDRFDRLTLDTDSPDFVERRINNQAAASIRVQLQTPTSKYKRPHPWQPACGDYTLQGGDDGLAELTDADFIGDSTAATGLYSWNSIQRQFALASIPERPTAAVAQTALEFAQQQQHFLFLLDLPAHLTAQQALQYKRTHHLYSDYAALFYPSVLPQPHLDSTTANTPLPNSSVLAGCMARTDALPGKGVAKAAAGIDDGRLFGLQALASNTTQQQGVRDLLYSHGINPLWVQPGVGIFNDGSQLSRLDGMVRFVNERRLLLFIRSSLQEGLRFVLHENICERLYHRINSSIATFLTRVWQQGGLRGNTAQEAFFVDTSHGPGSINPPQQEQQGQLTVAIGVATLKPAQFVDVTFTLKGQAPL